MIGQLINITIGLLTTLIGYIAGRAWQRFVDQIPYRQARRIWGPILSGELQIITSRFDSSEFSDPAGVVGAGDAMALRVLRSYFASISFKKVDEVYVDEPSLDRTKNLILLGGPDTNKVTAETLRLILPGVRVVEGPENSMAVNDLGLKSGSNPTGPVRQYVAEPNLDYGIIVRATNPFNPENIVIIIAGAYGYGSWGGANLVLKEEFLRRCNRVDLPKNSAHPEGIAPQSRESYNRGKTLLSHFRNQHPLVQFESIFTVGVYDKRPHAPKDIVLRSLQYCPEESMHSAASQSTESPDSKTAEQNTLSESPANAEYRQQRIRQNLSICRPRQGSGARAEATSDLVPYVLLAIVCLATPARFAFRTRREPVGQEETAATVPNDRL